ncbi:hypothetical protein HWV62_2019 [Athelia sp. TMB]|nr:hypothetical protein HWV62_2019 [Athelia sp. TMB]
MFAEILNSEESAPLSREAYVQLNSTISTAQFEAFLSLIYPAQLGVLVSRDETGWRNLLAFAAACDFTSLVTTALSGLNQYLKPIEKMLLGDKLAVPQLTAQGLREVCARAAPLSTKEGRELGIDNVMCVTNLREKTQCYMSGKADVLTDPLLKETLSQRDAEAAAAASSGNNEGPNGATAPADKMAYTAGKTTRFGGGQTPAADLKKSSDANKSQSNTNGAGAGANGNGGNIKGSGGSGSRQRG